MSSLVRGKQRTEGDNPSLKIEPQDDNDTRESVVSANVRRTDEIAARAALLIRLGQFVMDFEVEVTDGRRKKFQVMKETTDWLSQRDLDRWAEKIHVDTTGKKWQIFDVTPLPDLPCRTRFKLWRKLAEPQDILWCVVWSREGFGGDHHLYGWTKYPRKKPKSARGTGGASRRTDRRGRR